MVSVAADGCSTLHSTGVCAVLPGWGELSPGVAERKLGALLTAARERWTTPRRRVVDVHRLFYSAYIPVPVVHGEDDVDENEIIVYVPPT